MIAAQWVECPTGKSQAQKPTDAGSIHRSGKRFRNQSRIFSVDFNGVHKPPCTMACFNICAHVKKSNQALSTAWTHRNTAHLGRNQLCSAALVSVLHPVRDSLGI